MEDDKTGATPPDQSGAPAKRATKKVARKAAVDDPGGPPPPAATAGSGDPRPPRPRKAAATERSAPRKRASKAATPADVAKAAAASANPAAGTAKGTAGKAAPAKAAPRKTQSRKSTTAAVPLTAASVGAVSASIPAPESETRAETSAVPAETSAIQPETAATPVEAVTTPAEPAPAAESVPAVEQPAISAGPEVIDAPARTSLWRRLRTTPEYAAELLALTAVERLGGQAYEATRRLRAEYPQATADGLARLAVQRCVSTVRRSGFVSGLAGPLGVLADAGFLNWTQARLALHIAAAYGLDPTDHDRASDLLVLQRVHPSVETARAALDAARSERDPEPQLSATAIASRLAVPVGRLVGHRGLFIVLTRRAGQIVPGGGGLLGALVNARDTENFSTRAIAHFRRADATALGSSSTS